MPATVAKGGTIRLTLSLFRDGSQTPEDPDEFPDGPRFSVLNEDGTSAGAGVTGLPWTRRLAPGIFEFDLPIPLGTVLPANGGSNDYYRLVAQLATKGGDAMVDQLGDEPIERTFVVVAAATNDAFDDRRYATIVELAAFGVPSPTAEEITFAQEVMDGWMGRSLFPEVYRKRHVLPSDVNVFQLDYIPVIRLIGSELTDPAPAAGLLGRRVPGRRDRRAITSMTTDYLAAQAVFGSPTSIPIDITKCDFDPDTGQVWLPSSLYLLNYTQVQATYEAGLRVITRPIKIAMASIITWVRFKGYSPLTRFGLGGTSRETGDTFMTTEAINALHRYKVRSLR